MDGEAQKRRETARPPLRDRQRERVAQINKETAEQPNWWPCASWGGREGRVGGTQVLRSKEMEKVGAGLRANLVIHGVGQGSRSSAGEAKQHAGNEAALLG